MNPAEYPSNDNPRHPQFLGHLRLPAFLVVLALLAAFARPVAAAPPKLAQVEPSLVGMSSERLARIDSEVEKALAEKLMPGCVVAIGRRGQLVYHKAFGDKRVDPDNEPTSLDTVFDLASLTKPIATATSIMALVESGKLQLDDRVAKHLPEFGNRGKEEITVLQLLTHQGGLVADNALADYRDGRDAALEKIYNLPLVAESGSRFIYSDVGFIVLGELVARLSGQTLDQFAAQRFYQPLGMADTGYLPDAELQARCAPTERRDGQWLQGEVHDPRAARLDGVAGHAGSFSTSSDLAIFAQALLNGSSHGGVRILSRPTVDLMTTPVQVPRGHRALGWDLKTGFSSQRGEGMSASSYGHGGFTGTGIWIDPELELFVVFLSNRVHPDGKGRVNPLIGRISTIAVEAIDERPEVSKEVRNVTDEARRQLEQAVRNAAGIAPPREEASADRPVLCGIDVLERDGFAPLAGRRVGLITNHTGVNRHGVSTAELLHAAPNVSLVALFSPEHGLEGQLDQSNISDSRHPKYDVPVYSLYGKTRKPTPESLQGIDTLVFDIQDIGCRYYTYISTLGEAMEACAEQGKQIVVLDRPNPIGGTQVDGPLLDAGRESFVGFHRLPLRHGMTIGELAKMFNAERKIGAELQVVPIEGWNRAENARWAGLLWINPSPNMRNLESATLYPGIGWLEMTNLSVGRGTGTPFEIVGAPWLDGQQLAARLSKLGLSGVRFVPTMFTPTASKFANEACHGVQIIVDDCDQLDPVRLGFELARALRELHPGDWNWKQCDVLLGNAAALGTIERGAGFDEIAEGYRAELEEFQTRRAKFLLYEKP